MNEIKTLWVSKSIDGPYRKRTLWQRFRDRLSLWALRNTVGRTVGRWR